MLFGLISQCTYPIECIVFSPCAAAMNVSTMSIMVGGNRINFTLHSLPDVMEGDLDELSEALISADTAERLEAMGA